MTKKFYTDKDIEELFHSGVRSLQVNDAVVLTDLAYEKASRLGLELMTDRADLPPAAPVRPYLSDVKPRPSKPIADSVSETLPQSAQISASSQREGKGEDKRNVLEKRIREKVAARLGDQVDATLLDTIIQRTLKIIKV